MTTAPQSLEEVWTQMIVDVGGSRPSDLTLKQLMLTFGAAAGASGTGAFGVYNVVAYGADPLGLTDSTTAIKAALAAAGSAGGGVVNVPPGTYLVSSTMTIPANVNLAGSSYGYPWSNDNGATVISVMATTVTGVFVMGGNNSSATNLTILPHSSTVAIPSFTASGVSGISLKNIYASGVGGVLANSMSRSLLEDVVLQNWVGLYGFSISNSTIVFLNRCNAAPTGTGTISTYLHNFYGNNCFTLNFSNCESNGQPYNAFEMVTCDDCTVFDMELNGATVDQCVFTGCTNWALHSLFVGDNGPVNAIHLVNSQTFRIVGGTFDNFSAAFLAIDGTGGFCKDISVTGAYVNWESVAGPVISTTASCFNISIVGNTFEGSGTPIIYQDGSSHSGRRTAITGNSFSGTLNAASIQATTGNGVIVATGNAGYNPSGPLTAPSVPATTVAQANTFPVPVTVYLTGGTVTVVAIGGTATGLTSGAFDLGPGETITLTYTGSPTWTWFGN